MLFLSCVPFAPLEIPFELFKCCFRVIYEVTDDLARFFLRPFKVIRPLPAETRLFHQVASLSARPHQHPHYFCEKLHHFSRV